jgi:hypothetical protein
MEGGGKRGDMRGIKEIGEVVGRGGDGLMERYWEKGNKGNKIRKNWEGGVG